MCICVEIAEDVHQPSEPLNQSKSISQDNSPVAVADTNRKRQGQKSLSSRDKTKARKSDSAVVLQRDKPSSSNRASTGDANVASHYKASSKGSMHSKYAASRVAREENSIKFLSAERKRLEKQNEERKRRLEELKKQEMLIEAAAKKGGGFFIAK